MKKFLYHQQEAGLAVGGENFSPYIMLEVHINNEKMESGHLMDPSA